MPNSPWIVWTEEPGDAISLNLIAFVGILQLLNSNLTKIQYIAEISTAWGISKSPEPSSDSDSTSLIERTDKK